MKYEKIKNIKKKFHREWLLIQVDKMDEATTTCISGQLIAHSPTRRIIYQKVITTESLRPLLVDYSTDQLPKDIAVAFGISYA